jgi:hypothetical protein
MANQKSTTIEPGIRKRGDRPGYEGYVKIRGMSESKYFPAGTLLDEMRYWRDETRNTLRRLSAKNKFYLPDVPCPPVRERGGYVYFAATVTSIKVGKARNVAQRLEELQTANAEDLRLVGYVYSERPGAIECEILREFQHVRIRGEWFRQSLDLVKLIQRHASRNFADHAEIMEEKRGTLTQSVI